MNNRSCCPTKYIPRKPHNVSAVTSKRVVVEIVLDGDKGGGYAPNEEGAIAKTVGTNAYYEGSQKTVQPGDLKRQGKDETCNGTQLTECQKKNILRMDFVCETDTRCEYVNLHDDNTCKIAHAGGYMRKRRDCHPIFLDDRLLMSNQFC